MFQQAPYTTKSVDVGHNLILQKAGNHMTTQADSAMVKDTLSIKHVQDTVCIRNKIADITFYDTSNFVTTLREPGGNNYLQVLSKKEKERITEEHAVLVKHLHSGESLAAYPFHSDWLVLLIISIPLIYALIFRSRRKSGSLLSMTVLKNGTDKVSETAGLFQWQTTILNLVSFLVLSLFCYYIADYYDAIPVGFSNIVSWLVLLAVITILFSLRYVVCLVTGNLSGNSEAFDEYLVSISQSYHIGAFFLFIIIVLISFTSLLPPYAFFSAGLAVIGLIYVFRVVRLFLIFMRRNISIFYMILYLCSLEILPFLIAVRYFSNLV